MTAPGTQDPLLAVRHVAVRLRSGRRRFGGTGGAVTVVDGVSLDVRAGEIVAVVGESGGGKTTLARAVVGLCRPYTGEISVAGRPVRYRPADLRRLRREVQFIPQDPGGALNPRYAVGQAVEEALRIHRIDHRDRQRRRQRVVEALARVGLRPPERYLDRYPAELSGGQRARVAIAAALAIGPRVLVADEPVAALDASVRGEILALLLRLRDEVGLSVLLITHDLAVAWQVADSLVVLRTGRVVEAGATEDVVGAPSHPYTRALLEAAVCRSRRAM